MHAITADLHMSRGIAAKIKSKYPLHATKQHHPARTLRPGEVLTQLDEASNTFLLHVITKYHSRDKLCWNPNQFLITYLQGLRGALELCKKHDILELHMPRMGCSLDQLEWSFVEYKIHEICN